MTNKTDNQTLSSQPFEKSSQKNKFLGIIRITPLLFGLLPILAVGLALYGFLTSPLRLVQPEKTGLTPIARQIGQQFQVEFAGLRSIMLPTKQTNGLQLHLREPGATNDLRVSRASENVAGLEEGWVRFDFAPLETTYTKHPLFFSLETGGVPFQLAWSDSNVYLGGETYLDGIRQNGDLCFELEYKPDPAGLVARYFERQAAYNGLPWVGLVALICWLGLGVLGCVLMVNRRAEPPPTTLNNHRAEPHRRAEPPPTTLNNRRAEPPPTTLNNRRTEPPPTGGRFWLVALYFLLLGATGGLAFMFLTPPLQGLDEQGHVGRIVFVYEYNSDPFSYPLLFQSELELENQARYLEYVPGFSYDQPALNFLILYPLSESYQPPIYYAVAGGIVRLGSWLTGQHGLLFQLYLIRLTSLLFNLGALTLALIWAYYLRHEAAWLIPVVPTTYALLPTNLFISGVANNDNAVNFFIPLLLLCLTVLYKEGSTLHYSLAFWRKWWPLVIIGLGSAILAYQSKHTCGAFLGGIAFGVFIYAWVLANRRLRIGLLVGLGGLLFLAGLILVLKSPWQWQTLLNFLQNTQHQNRLLITVQVLILTFASFWCSAGWVNFSDAGQGFLMFGFFLLTLLVIWGLGRSLNLKSWINPKSILSWSFQLALTLGLASLAHIFFLILFRIITTYGQGDSLIEFPQGRFFLLALLPCSALIFGGLRATLPTQLRKRAPLWFGLYLWHFGLLAYSLIMLFGSFLPYYYNLN